MLGFIDDRGSFDGRVSGEDSGGLELCAPGGVSNGKSTCIIRENTLVGVLGADIGIRIWE